MSDSHRNDANVKEVLKRESDADYFLHCGDVCSDTRNFPDVIFVEGNCDYLPDLPKKRVLQYEEVRILMLHGDRLFDMNNTLAKMAKEEKCQIVIHGHTHKRTDDTTKGIRILNPGSLSSNRDGSKLGYLVINIKGKNYTVESKDL